MDSFHQVCTIDYASLCSCDVITINALNGSRLTGLTRS